MEMSRSEWRWRDSYIALVASVEQTRSNIAFYSNRRTNVSVVVE
jgi:hypothetical protein